MRVYRSWRTQTLDSTQKLQKVPVGGLPVRESASWGSASWGSASWGSATWGTGSKNLALGVQGLDGDFFPIL